MCFFRLERFETFHSNNFFSFPPSINILFATTYKNYEFISVAPKIDRDLRRVVNGNNLCVSDSNFRFFFSFFLHHPQRNVRISFKRITTNTLILQFESPYAYYLPTMFSENIIVILYLRISKPCTTSPNGAVEKTYSCSLATNFRIHPVIPSATGRRFANPVIFPVPPRKTGSRNVIRENRPCNERRKKMF